MTNWDFLKRVDFEQHDGVYLHMLNDFMRNQFYDRVLMNNVHDQRCLDIGFGTGLLSVLALKYGARSIVAYESDQNRYQLGCELIKLLNLTDITLLNQRYDYTMGLDNIDVVFTETIDGNLWNEGLYSSIPRRPGKKFLPGQYFLEIHALPIPESLAHGLIEYSTNDFQFAPGIDIDERFVAAVNLMIATKYNLSTKSFKRRLKEPVCPRQQINFNPGIVKFTIPQSTARRWIIVQQAVTQGSCVGQYVLDINAGRINTDPIDFNQPTYKFCIDTTDWQDKTVLIMPRAGMQHGQDKMHLDTGHWGTTKDPIILHRPTGALMVTHNLHTGKISYTIE